MLALLAARTVDECAGFLPAASFASFRVDLGLTYSQASLVLVLGAPGAMLGNVSAVLADHRSRRVIAAAGAFGYAASLLTFALGQTFLALSCASFTTGFSAHTLISGTELALVDVAGADVTAYLASGMLFGTAGGLLGPALLIGADTAGFGWRGAFATVALVVAAYGIWLSRLPLPAPGRPDGERRPWRGLGPVLRDRHVWYLGGVALLMGALQQPFVAFVVAYAEQVRGDSVAVATALAAAWIAGVAVAAVRSSRTGVRDARRGLGRDAALILAGTAGALVVPSSAAIALCIASCGFAMTRLTLTLKSRLVVLHPGRIGGAFALVSTIEFAGFGLPLAAGRLADRRGVSAGLAFFVALAIVLVLVALVGDRTSTRRRD